MKLLYRLCSVLSWLFRRSAEERLMDDELHKFVEMAAAKIRDGASPAEARRHALRNSAASNRPRNRCGPGHGALLDELVQNARYGARARARNPRFTTVVGLTLALGIGAPTACHRPP